ncbi:MAG TPA: Ig-like domain-containing protein [Terriglobales bacterium]|nr:Ig-like domain-containing protein [Terriglobales bacterium]
MIDAYSNPIPGVAVAFSDGGKGGIFSSPSATTDVSGHATTLYTTPSQAGIVHVTATVAGLKPATFVLTTSSP